MNQTVTVCDFCMPTYDMQGGPVPANIAAIIPNLLDPNTWNLAALSGVTRSMRLSVGTFTVFPSGTMRGVGAGRLDDRPPADAEPRPAVRPRVRQHAADSLRAVHHGRHADRHEQPRAACRVCVRVNDKTVIRGGAGKIRGREREHRVLVTADGGDHQYPAVQRRPRGFRRQPVQRARADLPAGARHSSTPASCEESARNLFDPNLRTSYAGRARSACSGRLAPSRPLPRTGCALANRAQEISTDVNLAFNLATGAPYSFSDTAHRVVPGFDSVRRGSDGRTGSLPRAQFELEQAHEPALAGGGDLLAQLPVELAAHSAAAGMPVSGRSRRPGVRSATCRSRCTPRCATSEYAPATR